MCCVYRVSDTTCQGPTFHPPSTIPDQGSKFKTFTGDEYSTSSQTTEPRKYSIAIAAFAWGVLYLF